MRSDAGFYAIKKKSSQYSKIALIDNLKNNITINHQNNKKNKIYHHKIRLSRKKDIYLKII